MIIGEAKPAVAVLGAGEGTMAESPGGWCQRDDPSSGVTSVPVEAHQGNAPCWCSGLSSCWPYGAGRAGSMRMGAPARGLIHRSFDCACSRALAGE